MASVCGAGEEGTLSAHAMHAPATKISGLLTSFSNRVRTLWNSLPDNVVTAKSVDSFKSRLVKFWNDQEVKFNWKADITGTGSRSNLT